MIQLAQYGQLTCCGTPESAGTRNKTNARGPSRSPPATYFAVETPRRCDTRYPVAAPTTAQSHIVMRIRAQSSIGSAYTAFIAGSSMSRVISVEVPQMVGLHVDADDWRQQEALGVLRAVLGHRGLKLDDSEDVVLVVGHHLPRLAVEAELPLLGVFDDRVQSAHRRLRLRRFRSPDDEPVRPDPTRATPITCRKRRRHLPAFSCMPCSSPRENQYPRELVTRENWDRSVRAGRDPDPGRDPERPASDAWGQGHSSGRR